MIHYSSDSLPRCSGGVGSGVDVGVDVGVGGGVGGVGGGVGSGGGRQRYGVWFYKLIQDGWCITRYHGYIWCSRLTWKS